ncbi:hypothetical protein FACS189444_3120 [Spirochaetia bacterium]|nr:hypothetical protein FACS189444_3120 [Spirochaetia bacterium]
MKKFLLAVVLAAALFTACDRTNYRKAEVKDAEKDYYTVFLFEVEGVRIYRFHDKGDYRYLAIGGQVYDQKNRITKAGKATTHREWDSSVLYAEGEPK